MDKLNAFQLIGILSTNAKRNKMSLELLENSWNDLGAKYAQEINEMIDYAEQNGWEAWDKLKKPEAKEEREDMKLQMLDLLREANENGTVNQFRDKFPPSREPFVSLLKEKGQAIDNVCIINENTLCFSIGAYQDQKYTTKHYLLANQSVTELDSDIDYIAKSKREDVFLLLKGNTIITTQGWNGNKIAEFGVSETLEIEKIEPSNDGRKLLLASRNHGVFLFTETDEKFLYPRKEVAEKEEDEFYMDMINITFSHDNTYMVVGCQDYDHDVFDIQGEFQGKIGPQSSYPHFCLFSEDDKQLITNSCHFYNGVTISVDSAKIKGLNLEAWEESNDFETLDDIMRVYDGTAVDDYYILGDANGYIRAIDKKGKKLWQHFIGSSIGSIRITADKKYLFVSTCAGILVKLEMNRTYRNNHTIGTAKLYEHYRLMMWKGEKPLFW